jgi:hypothetical protein
MTMTDHDWELLQREVDGENTTDESSALRERLAREPELVRQYQALAGVCDALDGVRLVEPPPQMVGDILRGIRQRAYADRPRVIGGVFGRLAARPALTLVSTLAAGLVVGVLATTLTGRLRPSPMDDRAVSGTVLTAGDLARLPLIQDLELGGASLGATVVTRKGDGVIVAEVEIRSPRPLDLTVDLDPEALRPRGFVSLEDLPTGEVTLEEDHVRVRQAPAGRYLLTLDVLGTNPAPLRVTLGSGEDALEGVVGAAPR